MSIQQRFYYDHAITGFVSRVYPIDPHDRRLYVDVVPADVRGAVLKAPVFMPPGFKRNFRRGAQVLLIYVDGNAQLPVVLGHSPNSDRASTYNQDPLAAAMERPGDLVIDHPETGAYLRFRDANASAGTPPAQDGGPVLLEAVMRSGMVMRFTEYNPPGYPKAAPQPPPTTADELVTGLPVGDKPVPLAPAPKPPRGKFEAKMPGGGTIEHDEPEVGKSIITQRTAGGHAVVSDDVKQRVSATSAQGHSVVLDDAAKTVTASTKGGHVVKMDDAGRITVTTKGDHKIVLDDVEKFVALLSAGGMKTILDDAAQAIVNQTEAGIETRLDDAAGQIVHKFTDQLQTVINKVRGSISHIAKRIGLGGDFDKLPDVRKALAHADLSTINDAYYAARRDDLVKFAAAMAASGIPNSAAIIGHLASLAKIDVPSGSSVVKIAE